MKMRATWLRSYLTHAQADYRVMSTGEAILAGEEQLGMRDIPRYERFSEQVKRAKRHRFSALINIKDASKPLGQSQHVAGLLRHSSGRPGFHGRLQFL
jgi:hypothetical protein